MQFLSIKILVSFLYSYYYNFMTDISHIVNEMIDMLIQIVYSVAIRAVPHFFTLLCRPNHGIVPGVRFPVVSGIT